MRNYCSCKIWLLFFLLLLSLGVLLLRLSYSHIISAQFSPIQRYENERNAIIQQEEYQRFGSFIHLSAAEEEANIYLMSLKKWEYMMWNNNDTLLKLNGDFRKMHTEMQKSLMYKILEMMPKGAALHTHEFALANTEFLLKLTYSDNLWLCRDPLSGDYELLKFAKQQPNRTEHGKNVSCDWILLHELRKTQGDKEVDLKLRESFTFKWETESLEFVAKIGKIEQLLKGLLTFFPVWQKYVTEIYKEFYWDNVQYLEIRSSLNELYDMEGNYDKARKTLTVLRNRSLLMYRNVNFLGSRLIYTLSRSANDSEIEGSLEKAIELKALYPFYILGIDLVNANPKNSRSLKEFSYKLLNLQEQFDFYLTNDETSWRDSKAHENILESYLLGTKRMIFHKALLHHPIIISKLFTNNVAIIINPISDQIFQNITNMSDHPASILFSYHLPLVISSDYPSYWQANPLTDDFYMTFMMIAGQQADLKVLKQLAFNSIYYSGLNAQKKIEAFKLWTNQWNKWICFINNLQN